MENNLEHNSNIHWPAEDFLAGLSFAQIPEVNMLLSQINRIQRDINELSHKIRRFEKQGNTIRAEELKVYQSYMYDALEDMRLAS